jgi:uncharacterized membrane protein
MIRPMRENEASSGEAPPPRDRGGAARLAIFADLIAACSLAVAFLVATVAFTGPLRFMVGLAFLAWAPGYSFVAAIFPRVPEETVAPDPGPRWNFRGGAPDWLERQLLACVIGFLLILPILVTASVVAGRLEFQTVAATIVAWTLAWSAMAAGRRRRLSDADRHRLAWRLRPVLAGFVARRRRVGVLVLTFAILVALVWGIAASSFAGSPTTELMLVDELGRAFTTDDVADRGTTQTVAVITRNLEGRAVSYDLRVSAISPNGTRTAIAEVHTFRLAAGASEQSEFEFLVPLETETVRFELFAEGRSSAYRWVEIRYQ